ncbi:40S ribosomal protein S6 [Pteropus alecto]|uniref:40S ribosomal protein S6 n=1 Tax=Pteropus alecto TaxID=9402 RepID=L5JZA3_PTEAL|nr:40S ribosomal protein S6 [Pteropus alecto]
MKLNISFPATGCQKLIEVDNERKLHTFYEQRMATGVAADALDQGGLEKECKSVRGCIVDANLSVLNVVIVKKEKKDISGLTGTSVPHRSGPKRVSRICKLFSLCKEHDAHQYVVRKPLNKESKEPRTTAPKIQCLVVPHVLQHKSRRVAPKIQSTKKNKKEAVEYAKLLAKRMKEAKEKCQEQIAKRRRLSSLRASTSKSESSQK